MLDSLPIDQLPPEAALGGVLVLAILQGLTEFLPISSSGHLVLAGAALDLPQEGRLALNVALHLGTLVAVLGVYRRDVLGLLRDLFAGRWSAPLLVVLGTLPAAIVGLGLKRHVAAASESVAVTGWGLLVTAVCLVIGEAARRRAQARARAGEDTRHGPRRSDALLIGLAQASAILPGISRSGATIASGMLRGLSPREAARFSFLLSIPTIAGAAVLELPDAIEGGFGGLNSGWVACGMLVSAIVGWFALRGLLATLRRGGFLWFALYCAVLGGLTLTVT